MKKLLHEKTRTELENEKASIRYDERLIKRRRKPLITKVRSLTRQLKPLYAKLSAIDEELRTRDTADSED